MIRMHVIDCLDRLAEMQAQRDVINLHFDDLRTSVLTPEIQAQLAEIEAERATSLEAASAGIAELEAEIKQEILTIGASVKGAQLQAVWTKGRVSWDTKALNGFAAAHPEIVAFCKEGVPSVSIRRVG